MKTPTEINRQTDLTIFQRDCLSAARELLSARGLDSSFELVEGEAEGYLRAAIRYSERNVEVYIYTDEAGFFVDGEWHIFEGPDFESDDRLITAFSQELIASLLS